MTPIPILTGLLTLFPIYSLKAEEPIPAPVTEPERSSEAISPQPRLEVLPQDVLATATKPLGERLLMVQKLRPLELPPLPEAPPDNINTQSVPGHEPAEKPTYVFVSATVHLFREQPDKPRTLVRFWFTPGSPSVDAWTNANFLWLMSSFGSLDTGGQRLNLLPTVSVEQWERPGATVMRHGQPYSAPEIPDFADENVASFVVAEGSPTEEQLAPLRALLAHYNASRAQLKADYEARAALAAEQARERAANPPEKKTLVLKYWRMDPAGQAGETTQPAIIR